MKKKKNKSANEDDEEKKEILKAKHNFLVLWFLFREKKNFVFFSKHDQRPAVKINLTSSLFPIEFPSSFSLSGNSFHENFFLLTSSLLIARENK